MSPEPAGDSPYLHHADYWVPAAQAGEYAVRQGDLFANVQTADGAHLDAALIVHPTCELGKASATNVSVARVEPLDVLSDETQRQQVVAGISEKAGGVRIAFAHTFFLAPIEHSALDIPMWADFRELVVAPREQFTRDTRIGALNHDAHGGRADHRGPAFSGPAPTGSFDTTRRAGRPRRSSSSPFRREAVRVCAAAWPARFRRSPSLVARDVVVVHERVMLLCVAAGVGYARARTGQLLHVPRDEGDPSTSPPSLFAITIATTCDDADGGAAAGGAGSGLPGDELAHAAPASSVAEREAPRSA